MITKNRTILILGLWIALIPFLGFPSSFKSFIVIASGILVAIFAFLLARDRRRMQRAVPTAAPHAEIHTDEYAENGPIWKTRETSRPY